MASSKTSSPGTLKEYQSFYDKTVKHNSLPSTKEIFASGPQIYIRDLIIDLSDLPTEVPGKEENANLHHNKNGMKQLFSFADVLTLTKATPLDFTEGGFLVVVGRTFCADGPQTLTIDVKEGVFTLALYCYDPKEKLTIHLRNGDQILRTHTFQSSSQFFGVEMTVEDGKDDESEYRQLDKLDKSFYKDDYPFSRLLRTQLRISALTMFSNPALSLAIGHFISGITYGSPVAAVTHLEASTILAQLQADVGQSEGGITASALPSVTIYIYEDALRALLDVASSYQAQYDRFTDSAKGLEERMGESAAILANAQDAVQAQSTLLAQTEKAWEDAQDALRAAEETTRHIEREARIARNNFLKAYREWVVKKVAETPYMVMKIAVETGVAVASAVKGGFFISEDALEKLSELEKLGKQLAAVGGAMEALGQGYNQVKGIPGNTKTVGEAIDGINQTIEETKSNINQIKLPNAVDGKYSSKLRKPDPEGLNGIAALEAMEIAIIGSMQVVLEVKVDKVEEYLTSFKRLMVFSKNVLRTKAAAAKAGQEYARTLLQYEIMRKQQSRLEAINAEKENQEALYAKQVEIFYDGLIAIKTFVVIQLRNYVSSYRFFSLQESAIVLNMQKSSVDLKRDFATLKQELASYLSQHSSDPQPFNLSTTFTDVQDLKDEKSMTFAYDAQNRGPFEGLSRVRLHGLRVWLDGAQSSTTIKLMITSNGQYQDFPLANSHPAVFSFSAQPLKRLFWYEHRTEKVLIDAVISDRPALHNPPTPFSQWSVSIQNVNEVDLSGVTAVRVDWVGTTYSV